MSRRIDWEGLKLTSPGIISLALWARLIDTIHTIAVMSVTNGRPQSRFGAGTHIEIDAVGGGAAVASTWPFKGYNTTINTESTHTAQMQFNGGDGASAGLNNGGVFAVACVGGNRTDTASGGPPATYPQLSITDNGYVYAKAFLNSDGTYDTGSSAGGTGVDIIFSTTLLDADSASPPTYGLRLLGTVTNYTTDGDSGNITFTYNDNVGPVGINTLVVCSDDSVQIT